MSEDHPGLIARAILIYGYPPGSPRPLSGGEIGFVSYHGMRIDGTEGKRD